MSWRNRVIVASVVLLLVVAGGTAGYYLLEGGRASLIDCALRAPRAGLTRRHRFGAAEARRGGAFGGILPQLDRTGGVPVSTWSSTEEILDFAILNEEKAHAFYLELADAVNAPAIRETLLAFAQEELGHKARLEAVKRGEVVGRFAPEKVADLKIADYLADVAPRPGLSFQEALIIAMKQERAAFKLYSDLAAAAADPQIARLFTGLAQEEAKHKLRFEIVYDEGILAEG